MNQYKSAGAFMPNNNISTIQNIEEVCVKENRIFDGRILSLRCDEVRTPSGRIATREVVEHKPAVGMLAITDHKTVLLVKQYRYAVIRLRPSSFIAILHTCPTA